MNRNRPALRLVTNERRKPDRPARLFSAMEMLTPDQEGRFAVLTRAASIDYYGARARYLTKDWTG